MSEPKPVDPRIYEAVQEKFPFLVDAALGVVTAYWRADGDWYGTVSWQDRDGRSEMRTHLQIPTYRLPGTNICTFNCSSLHPGAACPHCQHTSIVHPGVHNPGLDECVICSMAERLECYLSDDE